MVTCKWNVTGSVSFSQQIGFWFTILHKNIDYSMTFTAQNGKTCMEHGYKDLTV